MFKRQKPPLGSRLNTGHPLAPKVICAPFNEQSGQSVFDYGSRKRGVVTNGQWENNKLTLDGESNTCVSLSDSPVITDKFSVVLSHTPHTNHFPNTYWGLAGVWDTGASKRSYSFYRNSTSMIFAITTNGAWTVSCYQYINVANTLSIGTPQHLVGTWDGITVKLYIDGVLQSGSTTGNGSGSVYNAFSDVPFLVGAHQTSGTIYREAHTAIDYCYVHNQVYDAEMVAYLYANPYQMFDQPTPIWLAGSGAAGSTYQGTAVDGFDMCEVLGNIATFQATAIDGIDLGESPANIGTFPSVLTDRFDIGEVLGNIASMGSSAVDGVEFMDSSGSIAQLLATGLDGIQFFNGDRDQLIDAEDPRSPFGSLNTVWNTNVATLGNGTITADAGASHHFISFTGLLQVKKQHILSVKVKPNGGQYFKLQMLESDGVAAAGNGFFDFTDMSVTLGSGGIIPDSGSFTGPGADDYYTASLTITTTKNSISNSDIYFMITDSGGTSNHTADGTESFFIKDFSLIVDGGELIPTTAQNPDDTDTWWQKIGLSLDEDGGLIGTAVLSSHAFQTVGTYPATSRHRISCKGKTSDGAYNVDYMGLTIWAYGDGWDAGRNIDFNLTDGTFVIEQAGLGINGNMTGPDGDGYYTCTMDYDPSIEGADTCKMIINPKPVAGTAEYTGDGVTPNIWIKEIGFYKYTNSAKANANFNIVCSDGASMQAALSVMATFAATAADTFNMGDISYHFLPSGLVTATFSASKASITFSVKKPEIGFSAKQPSITFTGKG